jgi:hypothetical protein
MGIISGLEGKDKTVSSSILVSLSAGKWHPVVKCGELNVKPKVL